MSPGSRGSAGACPDEGTLVAFLDEALEPEREHRVAEHLLRCPACRSRVLELRERDRRVGAWIRGHDPVPPPREAYDLGHPGTGREAGHRTMGWLAAAAVALIIIAAAGPARGWIVDGVRSLFDGTGEVETEAVTVTPEEVSGATAVVPRGDEMTLVFTSPRTRGRVRIEPSPDARLTLREPDPGVRVTVGSGLVEVGNEAAPVGDYRVTVPVSLARLRLRVAGVGETVLSVAGLDDARTIELPPPAAPGTR